MTSLLKFQWSLLTTAAAILVIGGAAQEVSNDVGSAAVTLSPGASTLVEVFRLHPASVRASLEFKAARPRPELGTGRGH